MRALALVLAGATLGLPAAARADPHLEMRAAQQELKLARKHLKAAGRNYDGHRLAAIEQIEAALEDVRTAIEGGRTRRNPDDE